MMAPTSAHTTMEPRCSSDIPRRRPTRIIHHAPRRYPMAMPTPCGEMASGPMRTRSRMGHPSAARRSTAASLANHMGRDGPRPSVPQGSPEEQTSGNVRRVMHAEINPGASHQPSKRAETDPGRPPKAEVSPRYDHERRQHHGMAARPGRSTGLQDQQAVGAAGVEGANALPGLLEHLAHHPRGRRSGEGVPGLPAPASKRYRTGRADRCPKGAELRDPLEETVQRRALQ